MMNPFFKIACLSLLLSTGALAQHPMSGGKSNPMMQQMMSSGRFYGKVVDSLTGKPVEFANIQLWGSTFDTTTKKIRNGLITGQLTQPNGEFNLENLPVMGQFTLKISFMGYVTYEKKVAFNLNMNDIMKKMGKPGNDPTKAVSALNAVDVDLGNIRLKPDVKLLKEVEISGGQPVLELKLDKKVFNVEKNIVSTGGTAEDVLKNVPSVNVDVDGNVTLRNSAPQIFVDGKPTTLSLDQIPSDAIEKVEIMTNPSAKYDASGGGGGILNIVLKKARKIGYNGSARISVDSRGRVNGGVDLSTREGKINVFASVFLHQMKSKGTSDITRNNLRGTPLTNIYQTGDNSTNGQFLMTRGGFDYFMNNRNTFTFSGFLGSAAFNPLDNLSSVDSTASAPKTLLYRSTRNSDTDRRFNSRGGAVQYKHLYPKAGKELTADFNYFGSKTGTEGNYLTDFEAANGMTPPSVRQQQKGDGNISMMFIQTDYTNPVTEKLKYEGGLRASLRDFTSSNNNYMLNNTTGQFELLNSQSYRYTFNDDVFAAYSSLGMDLDKVSYQLGLRAEASFYNGQLPDSNKAFATEFPLSLFPSGFLTYKLSESDNLQLSYSRRVNRPTFFHLVPFIDYTDSLNLSRGNLDLKPEFTDVFELSYSKVFNRSHNVLASAYLKNTSGLIARYQVSEYNADMKKEVVVNTYENARSAVSYGIEFTSKNSLSSWVEIVSNLNLYNSRINSSNLESSLSNEQFGWFGKLNTTFKAHKDLSLQFIADYQSKTILPPSGGGGGRWGGMGIMSMGATGATTQGYIEPNYGLDVALKYEFLKNRMASLTLNVSDVLKTRKQSVHSESQYFIQNSVRVRDQQVIRLTLSYRFGKFDVSLFKRKNIKTNMEGVQDIMGM